MPRDTLVGWDRGIFPLIVADELISSANQQINACMRHVSHLMPAAHPDLEKEIKEDEEHNEFLPHFWPEL